MTREIFLADSQGKTFADVATQQATIFEDLMSFFSDIDRQERMEGAEIHHDRPPLAGVIRELEALQSFNQSLERLHPRKSQRLRQAIGVIVRLIMEQRGWSKTGRKGSLGIRAQPEGLSPAHNRGGLSFWFVRAERYQMIGGMPFLSVRAKLKGHHSAQQETGTTS